MLNRRLCKGKIMKDFLQISYQDFNAIFGSAGQDTNEVFWIRSSDFKKQIYLAQSYKKVWGHDPANMYENPEFWYQTLADGERVLVNIGMERRFKGENTLLYYRIEHPILKVNYIKDFSFYIHNADGEVAGIAGISKQINPQQWEDEIATHLHSQRFIKSNFIQSPFIDIFQQEFDSVIDNNKKKYKIVMETGTYCLTRRKAQCLFWLLNGKNSREIANILYLSPRTIEDHIDEIKDILGCCTQIQIFSKILNFNTIKKWKF